ncbi:MerR family transcriptional regulator [Nonomuraea angiospora]|uniref:DNA-binding transcriptional MerR regulator n=1 Tax=Nonomuraea angiospora TaxID=46172 RepID=A0ABR9MLH9_9ACTN|nr:MerR family transcriptional regulator [Nonomuraea angiospora]MBE1593752.1 DNA-binding transcriptional MerR regulator [Nonomuraea angiospora]
MALYSIGDLARRTGLTVKTIRFYSDRGIVPPADRGPTGYRLYDVDAVARLELVRTLRDLGVDLPTIRRVVEREVSLPEVAAAHAEALAVQIRTLRLRRAVLTAVARRGSSPEEMDLMHKLARLSEDERRRLVDDFLAAAFDGLDTLPGFAGPMRSMTPELPDDPSPEQVEAWVELAGLAQDADFRAAVRRTAARYAAERDEAGHAGEPPRPDPAALARDHARPALAAGLAPTAPEADPVVAAVVAAYARDRGLPDGPALRRRLLERLEEANDPRRERYLELLAVINGWAAPDPLTPALDWFTEALRARLE